MWARTHIKYSARYSRAFVPQKTMNGHPWKIVASKLKIHQRLGNLFCKEAESRYFQLCRLRGLCQLPTSATVEGKQPQIVTRQISWLGLNKTLFIKTGNEPDLGCKLPTFALEFCYVTVGQNSLGERVALEPAVEWGLTVGHAFHPASPLSPGWTPSQCISPCF